LICLNKVRVNADVHSYLGYAYRHIGNFNEAFNNYKTRVGKSILSTAARTSYVGEAYLLTNNLPKADEHLAALKQICGTGCEQYKDLAREIAEYRKKR